MRSGRCTAAATIRKGVRRLPSGGAYPGQADGGAGQNRQRVWHGEAGEGQNINHQLKNEPGCGESLPRPFRADHLRRPTGRDPYLKPEPDSAAAKYITATRTALGGYIPARFGQSAPLAIPELSRFDGLLKGSGERNMSTTMAFVNILGTLLKDVNIGKLIVPIVPDESRTFGMEGLFRQIGIHSWLGQLYTPQDAGQLSYYKEAKDGQILQEGINESGAISTDRRWHRLQQPRCRDDPVLYLLPMFGLQRVGDLARRRPTHAPRVSCSAPPPAEPP